MPQNLRQRPVEFWVALITALVVIFIGVEQGILLAILLSILSHTGTVTTRRMPSWMLILPEDNIWFR